MAVIGVGDDAAALRRGCLHRERSRCLSAFGMSDEVLKLMWKLTTNLNQQLAAIGMPSARRRRLAAHSLRHLRLQLEFSSQLWRAAGICLQHLLCTIASRRTDHKACKGWRYLMRWIT
jgi:hypothetical protein